MTSAIEAAERGWLPVSAVRAGIRRIVRRRLLAESRRPRSLEAWMREMAASPIAVATAAANAQHYEVPPAFFEQVLGPRLKYSSAYWPDGVTSLAAAEDAMLDLTMTRADLRDGQRILELGCGWGSLTLAMARRYPRASILGVSNSRPQREFILRRAAAEGLVNVDITTCDMNAFSAPGPFDRIVSVEMFEHMRNWAELLRRMRGWISPDGAVFVHVFAHRELAYPYEDAGSDDWMARHFFTGGMMPSAGLLPRVSAPWFVVDGEWQVSGTHYARTADAWHQQLRERRAAALAALADIETPAERRRVYHRWQLFFLACAELFGYRDGSEWIVAHYRLRPRPTS